MCLYAEISGKHAYVLLYEHNIREEIARFSISRWLNLYNSYSLLNNKVSQSIIFISSNIYEMINHILPSDLLLTVYVHKTCFLIQTELQYWTYWLNYHFASGETVL